MYHMGILNLKIPLDPYISMDSGKMMRRQLWTWTARRCWIVSIVVFGLSGMPGSCSVGLKNKSTGSIYAYTYVIWPNNPEPTILFYCCLLSPLSLSSFIPPWSWSTICLVSDVWWRWTIIVHGLIAVLDTWITAALPTSYSLLRSVARMHSSYWLCHCTMVSMW